MSTTTTISNTTTSSGDDDGWYGFDDDGLWWLTPSASMFYVPWIAASLSIWGSYIIVREGISEMRRGRGTAISLVMFSLSMADLFFSLGWFLGTWPAPKSLSYLLDTNHGTVGTCVAQGFILEIGGAATAYCYALMAWCYYLVIKCNVREVRMKVIAQRGIAFCWMLALVGAVIPIPLGMYNFSWYVCWIQAHPLECLESWDVGKETSTCERGDNAFIYSVAMQVVPRWTCFFLCAMFMMLLYRAARKLENQNSTYGAGGISSRSDFNTPQHASQRSSLFRRSSMKADQRPQVNRKRSKAVAVQGMLYCGAILVAFSCYLLSYMLITVGGIWNATFDTVAYFFTPLAGFLNLLVFVRTHRMQTQEGKLLISVLTCPVKVFRRTTLRFRDNRSTTTVPVQLSSTEDLTASDDNDVVASADWMIQDHQSPMKPTSLETKQNTPAIVSSQEVWTQESNKGPHDRSELDG